MIVSCARDWVIAGMLSRWESRGMRSPRTATKAGRADVFGVLIATCADCHARWIEAGDLDEHER
jgi:hypothetical protein